MTTERVVEVTAIICPGRVEVPAGWGRRAGLPASPARHHIAGITVIARIGMSTEIVPAAVAAPVSRSTV